MDSDIDYQKLNIIADIMLENNFEPSNLFLNCMDTNSNLLVNEQDENNFDDLIKEDVAQEIYDVDNYFEKSNNIWDDKSTRYLIFCWSQLRKQFANQADTQKTTLWQRVSECLFECGFYFDAAACEVKWRLLKKAFMFNRHNTFRKHGNNNCNELQITWKHAIEMQMAINNIPYEISDNENNYDESNGTNENVDLIVNADNFGEYRNTDFTKRFNHKFLWTAKSTEILIQLYTKHEKKYLATNLKGKNILWRNIAKHFSQLGYQYSASQCTNKWSKLKRLYKKNKQMALKYGVQYVKWGYFKDMDKIFKKKPEETLEHNGMVTISLLNDDDDEQVDAIKEKKNYENLKVLKTNETTEEELSCDSSSDTWTEPATKCLIELWGLHRSQLQLAAPRVKKLLLWNKIGDQLCQKGHTYSGKECELKWHNLKTNYIKKKENYKNLGTTSIEWQYYHDLDKLLGVHANTISWSMDSTMCLIDCFENHKTRFMNAVIGEKFSIWKQISEEMSEHGFNYTPRACDNKWRTLKNRYNKNKMSTNQNKKKVWVYYNKIDSVLGETNSKGLKGKLNNGDVNIETNKVNELDKDSYDSYSISEVQNLFRLRNEDFDKRLRFIEDNLNSKDTAYGFFQKQLLEALKTSNKLEMQHLKLLEKLFLRLPYTS